MDKVVAALAGMVIASTFDMVICIDSLIYIVSPFDKVNVALFDMAGVIGS